MDDCLEKIKEIEVNVKNWKQLITQRSSKQSQKSKTKKRKSTNQQRNSQQSKSRKVWSLNDNYYDPVTRKIIKKNKRGISPLRYATYRGNAERDSTIQ